ncbi:MAG: dienelactone hydrolase family protein [Alphaproteobacteria bacterium]|nr:dienelactone hydrolase family protein [Pseudomonadota bacterium]TDI67249.1 MAG: dienelactone hydrolase family protein [Alphaproteobacteria bacterium]
MASWIDITAADGHRLSAWQAEPEGRAKGGLVIAQEMYGVNGYLRGVVEHYAAKGYLAIAPRLYDRLEPGLTIEYDDEGNRRAKQIYRNYDWSKAMVDLEAARDAVAMAGRVAILGFCFGGSLAWLAACRSSFACAVAYYGGEMTRYMDEDGHCPVQCHVGALDTALSPKKVAQFQARYPDVPFHVYPGAVHGFDNETRGARHHPEATKIARARTLVFLDGHMAGGTQA